MVGLRYYYTTNTVLLYRKETDFLTRELFRASKGKPAMADKRPHEQDLAAAVHQAERAYGDALAAPAGSNRIERIERAAKALSEAEDAYSHLRSGRGYPLR
jgi:hypothetical protein